MFLRFQKLVGVRPAPAPPPLPRRRDPRIRPQPRTSRHAPHPSRCRGDRDDLHVHLDLERLLLTADLSPAPRDLPGVGRAERLHRRAVDLGLRIDVRHVRRLSGSPVHRVPRRSALPDQGIR